MDIDFLKIDVEGAEIEVLKGSKRVLEMVNKTVVEAHSDPKTNEVRDILQKNDFDVNIERAGKNQLVYGKR